jgi:hypothetical protein
MPREIIGIPLSTAPPPEGGATLFSAVAYSNPVDAIARDQFRRALCRWAILARSEIDEDWATTPQSIRPEFFVGNNAHWWKQYKLGEKKLNHRLIAAYFIAMPNIKIRFTGHREKFKNYEPTVQNMSQLAMDSMGWRGDSEATMKSRIWGQSRAVVHAAAAFLLFGPDFTDEVNPPTIDPFLACLMFPELLRKVVLVSEILRLELLNIKQFKIRDEDTIQFVPD